MSSDSNTTKVMSRLAPKPHDNKATIDGDDSQTNTNRYPVPHPLAMSVDTTMSSNNAHLSPSHQHHQFSSSSSPSPSPTPTSSDMLPRSIYHSPTATSSTPNRLLGKNLKIDVPSNDADPDRHLEQPTQHHSIRSLQTLLGEPLSFQQQQQELKQSDNNDTNTAAAPSTKAKLANNTATVPLEDITQLPTPVLPNDSFANYSHYQQTLLSSPPKKRDGANWFKPAQSASPRIISDFKPIARAHSLNTGKRVVSNPVELKGMTSASSTESSTSTDRNQNNEQQPTTLESPITPTTSPIISQQTSKYDNVEFYSQRYHTTFKFVKELGQGNFSTVILARSINDEVAIKVITIPESKSQIVNFKSFILRELNILYHVSYHPCITSLLEYDITLDIKREEIEAEIIPEDIDSQDEHNTRLEDVPKNRDQLIFINYCHGGNLLSFLLEHSQSLNENSINYWIYIHRVVCELILTTSFLHQQNVIHRDIKLENILLLYSAEEVDQIFAYNETMSTPFMNLSDFGLSKKLTSPNQLSQTRCGSQDYIAPEVLMGLQYDGRSTDTWSIGVLVYSILESKLPFDVRAPSASSASNSGISPSVLKRRRSKKISTAHRIAMIDWGWQDINERINNEAIDEDIRVIQQQLKSFVDAVLVRKDRRPSVGQILEKKEFNWIKQSVPQAIVSFNQMQ
ncbi:serine/threonine protein kinase [Candida orthopsilosis Co 90-125]|uniref:Serine/threonine protein kinase n=1 Tax=Candida orthopsilosis (strain 90-125) TaxID=1136231 RepID=H8X7C5_CANO9|nr:serine/threonine protein kinase [Candida orthopsilosis Co 90-125]CCG24054.1 serine/threonine protein kinase [Candida orthopsilosis Co 90-125]